MDRIAVIGMGCHFPGAVGVEGFWRALMLGHDTTSEATVEQMGSAPGIFFNPAGRGRDSFTSLRGGYIREHNFDPTGYRVPAEALAGLDPLFQWSLGVARQALDASGQPDEARARCGVVLGNLSFPTRSSHHLFAELYGEVVARALGELLGAPGLELGRDRAPAALSPLNALIAGYPAALIAHAIGLGGPTLAIDAACASSLYALKVACQYLAHGKADLMLAGAVSAADPLLINIGFSIFQAYPKDGASRPLDARSQGLVAGEGAGFMVLKREADALRDGDTILALIAGIGLSNDGRGSHLLTPNPKGQLLAFERAYAAAGVEPEQIDYVECHATGTPLGDSTELGSMEVFFGPRGAAPLIGSVKAGIGHLLTAAGMASTIKTILAMAHGQLPPTVGVAAPLSSRGGHFGPDQIVRAPTAWPERGRPRRAGVSSFGFGGTNAHLVLEQPGAGPPPPSPTPPPPAPRLAIIGMDAHFGPCAGLVAFERAIYAGAPRVGPLPPWRWKGVERHPATLRRHGLPAGAAPPGAYIEAFEADFLRYRTPPIAGDQPIAQQLLVLKVIDNAIRDAGLAPGGNVAVLVAMGAELGLHQFRGRVDLAWQLPAALGAAGIELAADELAALVDLAKGAIHIPAQVNQYISFIGNIMASRVAALWDFTGPALTVAAEESSVYKAVELAQLLLAAGEVDAVVVGAVDLAGGLEAVLARARLAPVSAGPPTLSHDASMGGWVVGEGAGAVVLTLEAAARRDGTRAYALIDAVAIVHQQPPAGAPQPLTPVPDAALVAKACRAAFAAARLGPGDVGYVELHGSGVAEEDRAEAAGLKAAYAQPGFGPRCAVGSAKAVIGHTYAASGMASLIKVALCLCERYLPATQGLTALRDPALWAGGPFYAPADARPWLLDENRARRVAALCGLGRDSAYAHLILSEARAPAPAASPRPFRAPAALVPLAVDAPVIARGDAFGMSEADAQRLLAAQLDALEARLPEAPFPAIAARAQEEYERRSEAPYALALVAHDTNELREEIAWARRELATALADGEDRQSPRGSAIAPRPLGPAARVAFVYPGGEAGYPGAGRELGRLFPQVYRGLEREGADLALTLGADVLYPRSLGPLDEAAAERMRAALAADVLAAATASTGVATVHTKILRECLGVRPHMAFGYCMGEASMLWAMGVWQDPEGAALAVHASPLFRTRFFGPRHALRDYFAGRVPGYDQRRWANFLLAATPAAVADALAAEPYVFMAIVNTPDQVLISGDAPTCLRVIERLGCGHTQTRYTQLFHCPVVVVDREALTRLYTLPVRETGGVTFYTATRYGPLPLGAAAVGQALGSLYCQPIDFPRLVERLYQDGARVFVECGPSSLCTQYVGATLAGRPHLAVPMARRGADEALTILRAAARLISHRLPLRLDALRPAVPVAEAESPGLVQRVRLGGPPIDEVILAAEQRARFGAPGRVNGTLRAPEPGERRPGVIWDRADLLAFAEGGIAGVFGPAYAAIDAYRRRVRLPTPPYLLVDRVTAITGQFGKLEPSTITTEYAIPHRSWYSVDGQAPLAIVIEAGQCDLLLISYLGVDLECRGERVYRLLDCTLTFLDELPREGTTLRYAIRISSFARSGDTLLFFFSYDCYAGERLILKMERGCAGFFSDAELAAGQGVVRTPPELAARAAAARRPIAPPLVTARRSLGAADLAALSRGDLAAVFGPAYDQGGANPALRLGPPAILMLDAVTLIEPDGGPWGLGRAVAEKQLDPDDWYFPCHFKDDQVLAGSLMAEGCAQLLQVFMLATGLQTLTRDARFQPIAGLAQVVRCRGQVRPCRATLTYVLEVTSIELGPRPAVRADVAIVFEGRTIVHFHDLGLRLAGAAPPAAPPPRRELALDEEQIRQFATGSVAACFGPAFQVYATRRAPRTPNGELQLVSRVRAIEGERGAPAPGASLVAEYDVPSDAWFLAHPGEAPAPYGILMELALQPCGLLSFALGSTLPLAHEDLYFRNLDGRGELLGAPDLRGHTLVNRVELRSSAAARGVIIQSFAFELRQGATPFYRGEATFGYFTAEALAHQAGLDGGRSTRPWHETAGFITGGRAIDLRASGAGGLLDLLDEALVVEDGGRHGAGYVYGRRRIRPADWFFARHFKDDPVMPGSLGVEAVAQALRVLAASGATGPDRPPLSHSIGHATRWKYRGQITPSTRVLELEAHIAPGDGALVAEASVWCDGLRIYEVRELSLKPPVRRDDLTARGVDLAHGRGA